MVESNAQFKKLFEATGIGIMRLKNRLVMAPMGTNFASVDGYVTQCLKRYYEERAKGGVGLVIVEATCVDYPRGAGPARQLSISDDVFIPGLKELVNTVKKHGAKIAIQLHHAGAVAHRSITHLAPIAPSPVPHPGNEVPEELTIAEINDISFKFVQAAKRAKESGFDGIELHCASAYLIAEFLSPYWNRRSDKYGGDLTGRALFLLETIKGIRRSVGYTYPVWCRINAVEYGLENGVTIDESAKTAELLQEIGVNAIHLSAWGMGKWALSSLPNEPGAFTGFAGAIKKVVAIPVIVAGRITPQIGEQILSEQKADLVSLGRGLLTDPYLPSKVASDKLDEILPCIGCYKCIERVLYEKKDVRCTVNAALGKEPEVKLHPAVKQKRVLIVGGGPAGMETARVAAQRGHKVVLFERESQLGGQLIAASKAPHKQLINCLINYYEIQMNRVGVDVRLKSTATAAKITKEKPDVVVIAAGMMDMSVLQIPGLDQSTVVDAKDVLLDKVKIEGKNIIIIGGGLVGCETAEFLSGKGKVITILEMLPRIATKLGPFVRPVLMERLVERGITVLAGVTCVEVADGKLFISKDGAKQSIAADSIVIAAGGKPKDNLFQQLKSKIAEIYLIGDCKEPRTILEAIDEGFDLGCRL